MKEKDVPQNGIAVLHNGPQFCYIIAHSYIDEKHILTKYSKCHNFQAKSNYSTVRT